MGNGWVVFDYLNPLLNQRHVAKLLSSSVLVITPKRHFRDYGTDYYLVPM